MEIQEPEKSYIKEQIEHDKFGETNSFIQLIHHFRTNCGEFEGRVFGYLTLDMVISNSKIERPILLVSDLGENGSQVDNTNKVVLTRGIEITFATPLKFKNDYFDIHDGVRGENLLNHFTEFKYRLLQAVSTFRPTPHNASVVSIKNFRYQGARFVGIEANAAYYVYDFSYEETLNLAKLRPTNCLDDVCWSLELHTNKDTDINV